MTFSKLNSSIKQGKTILGVGPMSWNCIDSVIEVANEQQIPIQLIASRRQVERAALGGGYVTSTERLAKYVRAKDAGNYVLLARDHGGPWQGANEEDLTHDEAMCEAILSYDADVKAGFDILHLDPSLKSRPLEDIIKDIHEFHILCEGWAEGQGKEIFYEVGTEEHSGQISDITSFRYFVHEVAKLPNVNFVVGNMGYWVKELENVGEFDEEQASDFVKVCNWNGVYLKGHNSDYLTGEQLSRYNKIGVHSINIAPELGTAETEELLYQLEFLRMDKDRQKFIDLAVKSGKWKKWMKDDAPVPDLYKAKICGHYIFETPEVLKIKEKAKKKGFSNLGIKLRLKGQIMNTLEHLGWDVDWER